MQREYNEWKKKNGQGPKQPPPKPVEKPWEPADGYPPNFDKLPFAK